MNSDFNIRPIKLRPRINLNFAEQICQNSQKQVIYISTNVT